MDSLTGFAYYEVAFHLIRAGRIIQVYEHACYVQERNNSIRVLCTYAEGMTARRMPEAGDYWVIFQDGYQTIIPKKSFEDAYTLYDGVKKVSVKLEVTPEPLPPLDPYRATLARLEPDIAAIDASTYYASAAISLKRQADAAEDLVQKMEENNQIMINMLNHSKKVYTEEAK